MKKGLKWLVPLSFAGMMILTPHMANANEQNKVWRATPVEEMDVDTSNPQYKVKWGDTLFNLGIRTGSDVNQLFNMNKDKISNVNDIKAHSIINIPTGYHYKGEGASKGTDVLTDENAKDMEKDVKYFTSDGKHYVLNGKCYTKEGKPLADMTIDEIKKLPLQNGIYDVEKVK